MSSTTLKTTLSTTPTTYGTARYVSAGYIPKPGSQPFALPATSEFGDERKIPLNDLRPIPTVDQLPTVKEGTASLLTHGFTALKHSSILHWAPYTHTSWHDPELVQEIYVPEVTELLKRVTGAKTVVTEVVLMRGSTTCAQDARSADTYPGQKIVAKNTPAENETTKDAPNQMKQGTALPSPGYPIVVGFSPAVGGLPPAPKVHLDFAPAGARTHIRLFHPMVTKACAPIIAAEDRLLAAGLPLDAYYATAPDAPRWAIYSIWRPLKPVKRDPLAVGDARSFAKEDYVPIDVPMTTTGIDGERKEPHTMKAYVSTGRDDHRWYYINKQMPDEVLIIGLWDSSQEGDGVGAGAAMHTSVEIEGLEGEEPRESLELRCLAIW